MADIKKFLDQQGTTYLWKKIAAELDKKAAASTVSAIDTRLGTAETKIAALEAGTYDDTAVRGLISTNASDIDALEGRMDTAEGDIADNAAAIELLNKTDGTVGSVKKTVDDAIAAIVASAPSDFDTLKEISDWISGHSDSASAMNSDIAELKRLTAGLGTTGDPAAAKTVKQYVDDAIAGLAIGDYAKAADLTALAARVTALEGKVTDAKIAAWDAAEQNAKTYADSLASNYDASGAAAAAETAAKAYADGLASNYATAAQGAKADTALQPADVVALSSSEIDAAIAAANT